MTIYQIIFGEIPEHLLACVESVKSFAERSKNSYKQITDVPEKLLCIKKQEGFTEYFKYRLIKDWVVLDLLYTEENILIVDWDIFMYSIPSSLCSPFNVSPGRYPVFASNPIDCMIYNSCNLTPFLRMREFAGEITDVRPGTLLPAMAIHKYKDETAGFKYTNFDNKTYKHLDNCRLMQ